MIISEVMEKMVRISEGNTHDIEHFLKVYAFAKTIAEMEKVDSRTKEIIEISAIIHDIACPICRVKYGNTDGKNQEKESPALIEDFLKDFGIPEEEKKRISWIVSHHHTYTDVDGIDWQIILEADFLVNADESHYTEDSIVSAMHHIFKTDSGKLLLKEVFPKAITRN